MGVVADATVAEVNGVAPLPVASWKIVERWSVPNARPPVEPGVTGCDSAKYDASASTLLLLQVLAAVVTTVAVSPFARFTSKPLLTTLFALRSGLMKPDVLPAG